MKKETTKVLKNLEDSMRDLALRMALNCVRNTVIEDYHCGVSPSSKTGDYSDVRVISPYGEIPWNNLSRLSDEEMQRLNKEVVNKIYTFLLFTFDPRYQKDHKYLFDLRPFPILPKPTGWDKPELDGNFIKGLRIVKYGPDASPEQNLATDR